MSRSIAQPVVVQLAVAQTVEVQPPSSISTAQQITVSLSVPQLIVQINPVRNVPIT
jgi:hypothetical protein